MKSKRLWWSYSSHPKCRGEVISEIWIFYRGIQFIMTMFLAKFQHFFSDFSTSPISFPNFRFSQISNPPPFLPSPTITVGRVVYSSDVLEIFNFWPILGPYDVNIPNNIIHPCQLSLHRFPNDSAGLIRLIGGRLWRSTSKTSRIGIRLRHERWGKFR